MSSRFKRLCTEVVEGHLDPAAYAVPKPSAPDRMKLAQCGALAPSDGGTRIDMDGRHAQTID